MLSQSVSYAALALGVIAGAEGKPVSVSSIAKKGKLPIAYLGKLINALAHKDILTTQRGVGGGVRLAVPANKLTLFDIAAALNDPVVNMQCMLGNAECSDERACPCHSFWVVQREVQIKFLKKTTIEDFNKFEQRVLDNRKRSEPKIR